MRFSGEIRHMLLATLACLALVGLSAAYWAINGGESLLLRDDNPRIIEAQARIRRGAIYDSRRQLLAETSISDAGLTRRYFIPSTFSLTGYYSLRYGVGGAEAAYDGQLAGRRPIDSLSDYFNSQVLQLPQVGADITLTVDAQLHDTLAASMAGLNGAAVVMDAKTGALLALHSQPSYDPNRLDEDWSDLVEADGNPFFNRALQGNYQLGGNIYALWLAQASDAGFELSLRFTDATLPVELTDTTTLTCLAEPPTSELTLPEALIYGCPAPFVRYMDTPSAITYADLAPAYRFADGTTLAGFPAPEALAAGSSGPADPEALARLNALGQGDLTTTPLHLVRIIAAIANDGVAVEPHILASIHDPEDGDKRLPTANAEARRFLSASSAATLKALLQESWLTLYGSSSDPTAEVGAYAAMSRAGDKTQVWLNGYVARNANAAAAFVILLEDTAELQRLLTIGAALSESLSLRE